MSMNVYYEAKLEQPTQRKEEPCRALVYASLLPIIREVGRKHGYAIAVHGSMTTDLDLIACPWVEDASDEWTLIQAIHERFCSMYAGHFPKRGDKPHGRMAYALRYYSKDFEVPFPSNAY